MSLLDGFRGGNSVIAMAQRPWDFAPEPTATHTLTAANFSGLFGPAVTFDSALTVPAFARALSLITGVAGSFPLVPWQGQTPNLLRGSGISAVGSDSTLVAGTVSDLVCHGVAAWVITRNQARRVSADQLVQTGEPQIFAEKNWEVAGYSRGRLPGDLIVFDSGTAGVLSNGWQALTTAMMLESAAQNMAESPTPTVVLKSSGIDLTTDEALGLLAQWSAARKQRSTAYLPSNVDATPLSFNSAELQLVEARNHSAVEIARLMGVAAYWVDAGVSGSSVTYANREDQNQALLDQAVMPRLRVIEQTLSRYLGSPVRFDPSAFLRANVQTRSTVLNAYVASGVISTDEARAMEPMILEGQVPE